MPADVFVWILAQVLFLGVFVRVGLDALRRQRRSAFEIALFFGLIAAILILSDLPNFTGHPNPPIAGSVAYALLSILPYLLLRLADDFSPQPRPVLLASGVGVFVLVGLAFLPVHPAPVWYSALPELWFIGVGGYATFLFARGVQGTRGVTSRRMFAVAVGSGLIAVVLLLALVALLVPSLGPALTLGTRAGALAAGVAYVIGFWPPQILRRAWQEPELRAFLERAASLPRLPDLATILHELERGAADAIGAPSGVIGLWDSQRGVLRYTRRDGSVLETGPGELVGGICFQADRPLFIRDAAKADPQHAELYQQTASRAVMGCPIRIAGNRLGVLLVYGPRAPLFAEEDLQLVELMADQSAVILESRALIDSAAEVMAREEATRLKDDFLSAAAHDLRSPLTTLLLHAELMQRALNQNPGGAADADRVATIVSEAKRLRELVTAFLDASRVGGAGMLESREAVDLVGLAREVCATRARPTHPCEVEAAGPVVAGIDRLRMRQLIDNLVSNAIKYTPGGGTIRVVVAEQADEVQLSVTDNGIGIPAADIPHLFQRFHRGSNVDDRRFQGLGLGLYICHAIVREHGGRIWASSELGRGTTFHVALPVASPAAATTEESATEQEFTDVGIAAAPPAVTEPQAETTTDLDPAQGLPFNA